jgi:hypothetical protein
MMPPNGMMPPTGMMAPPGMMNLNANAGMMGQF